MTTGNYVAKLNEYSQKTRSELKYEDVRSDGPDHIKTFTVRVVLNGKMYPDGVGKTKKEAKQNAAENALRGLLEEPGDERYCGSPGQQNDESKHNMSDICDQTKSPSVKIDGENFIGLLNQYCQKTKRHHDYILEDKRGQAHSPLFFYRLVIDKKPYPVGEGKTVKEAKQDAARLAWTALNKESNCDKKVTFCSAVSDDEVQAGFSTQPHTPESNDAQSKRVQTNTGDSAFCTSSMNVPKEQSPSVKPKIRIAANFPNACKSSLEAVMPNFKMSENSPSDKTSTQSTYSRFTKDFDSIEQLGKGSFGCVFKAKEKLLGNYYAVKVIRCKKIKKALREVKVLSEFHHHNIVRYYTCWLEESGYQRDSSSESSSLSIGDSCVKYLYIQMELCDTKTLRLWIDEKNTQNVKSLQDPNRREESLSIAQQIVSGVEYIHLKKFIHRDLKPANIMFGRDRRVKIGDFGLVTAENDDDAENLIERTFYKGTPCYMAPEQKLKITYDRKVDIFALGLIYFELLWNLCGESREVWEDARKQKLPHGFSHNFPQENKIIKSMLCLKPEERPEAAKLKQELDTCTLTFQNSKGERHTF